MVAVGSLRRPSCATTTGYTRQISHVLDEATDIRPKVRGLAPPSESPLWVTKFHNRRSGWQLQPAGRVSAGQGAPRRTGDTHVATAPSGALKWGVPSLNRWPPAVAAMRWRIHGHG